MAPSSSPEGRTSSMSSMRNDGSSSRSPQVNRGPHAPGRRLSDGARPTSRELVSAMSMLAPAVHPKKTEYCMGVSPLISCSTKEEAEM